MSIPHVMVVTDFSCITQTDILAYSLGPPTGAADANLQGFLENGILTDDQIKAFSRDERIVSGNETARISISVEVYNFK